MPLEALPQWEVGATLTLKEAIVQVLEGAERPLRSRDIADCIAARSLYLRRDGSAVPPSDVNVCPNDNKTIFHVERGLISLREYHPLSVRSPTRSTAQRNVRHAPK